MSNNSQLERKVAKCAGCGTPITEHGWVFPSKFYQGEEISSPIAHKDRQNVTIEKKRTKLAAGEPPEQAGPSNVKYLSSLPPSEALTTPLDGTLNLTTYRLAL
ncbi:hypothetical protein pdam_00023619 [Pocillopora damicornis]|uniref:Uncharacterized protein n=1 Tax=Pocillopora damicornis TaxID=46731 RepID=A0A3M6TFJ7_POCDA|nr:hypothetical protein pdam_00023619 [Pocillopora damicornis]